MRGIRPLLLTLALTVGAVACSDESCPGIICSNCAGSGDCDIQCPEGQIEYCGHYGYFDDPDLRCAWCGNP